MEHSPDLSPKTKPKRSIRLFPRQHEILMNIEPDDSLNHRRRGIYLLPNLFTTAGLFAGFYAIVAAMKGQFDYASIAIFVAMIMDALDGRVARLTHTQTAFGAEYDSLADMAAFGVAPALVMFSWSLSSVGKFGWLAAFIYVAAGALRLARFNTQIGIADKRYFQGLPIPAAASVLTSAVWLGNQTAIPGDDVAVITAVLTILVGLLMVSNVRYHSFKQIDFKNRIPFIGILVVVLIFAGIAIDPPKVLFLISFCYALWGPLFTLWTLRKTKLLRKH
jgi:CDP-diacylglycerol--serine O-phosphatidyltransferase